MTNLPSCRWTWRLALLLFVWTTQAAFGAAAPYPLVLVHGLLSSDQMWVDSGLVAHLNALGFSNGGVFQFTLGQTDRLSDVSIEEETVWSSTGDVWRVNFASPADSASNVAAIYLQAQALKLAIGRIKVLTGAQKVVLIGHSMGGLAAAAYVGGDPNGNGVPDLYGGDVAKLITLGTPFGGAALANLLGLFGSVPGLDTSNAIRDLSKDSINHRNVFVFGGYESEVSPLFVSRDVNANRAIDAYRIPGIKEGSLGAPWPAAVDYFALIGDWVGSGDCVVVAADQYLSNLQQTKVIHAGHGPCSFCGEAASFDAIVEALDEPSASTRAWSLRTNSSTKGFLTRHDQAGTDVDTYALQLVGAGSLAVTLSGISVPGTTLRVLNANGSLACAACSASASTGSKTISLSVAASSPATYYVEVSGAVQPSDPGFATLLDPLRNACDAADTNCPHCRTPYTLGVSSDVGSSHVALAANPATVSLGAASQLTAQVLSPAGSPAGAGIQVTFAANSSAASFTGCTGPPSACSAQTDANGRAQASLTSAVAGSIAVTAAASTGGSASTSVTFSYGSGSAQAVPNPVAIDQPSTLTAVLRNGAGVPVPAGTVVTFRTSYPGFFTGNGASSPTSPSNVVTDASGSTWIRFSSSVVGTANITVEVPGVSPILVPVQVFNPSPTLNVALTVGYFSGDAGSSTYEVEAYVTNQSGQVVIGQQVDFTTTAGTLSRSRDFTTTAGIAQARLTVNSSGSVTVTGKAGTTTAGTSFFAQVGTPACAPMTPVRSLTFGATESYGVAYTPDGNVLIASGYNGNVRAWNTSDWQTRWSTTTRDNRAVQVSTSPDSSLVLVNHDDGQDVFAVSNGTRSCALDLPTGEESLNGCFISSSAHFHASDGTSTNLPQVYRHGSLCATGSSTFTMPGGDDFQHEGHMDFSGPGRNLVAVGSHDGDVYVFNAGSGSLVRSEVLTGGSNDGFDVDFSADETKLLAVGWRTVKIYNTTTWAYTSYSTQNVGDWVYGARFLDNDSKIALGGEGVVEIQLAAGGACYRRATVPGNAVEIDWSASRAELAVATSSGAIQVFRPFDPPDLQPPILNITHPPAGFATNSSALVTTGRVTDANQISSFTINGIAVALNAQGNFNHRVSLTGGTNTLSYQAQDAGGNAASEQRTVTYNEDTTGPVITSPVISPTIGPAFTSFLLRATVIDGDSGVASVTASVRNASGGLVAALPMVHQGSGVYQAAFDSTPHPNGVYSVDVLAVDTSPRANARSAPGIASFQIAACQPLTRGHGGSGTDPVATPASSPGCAAGAYYQGTAVALLARPAAGWEVAGWSGSDRNLTDSWTNSVTMPNSPRSVSVEYVPSAGRNFYTLTPCRLIDTRSSIPLTNGVNRLLDLGGRCGIPASAKALSVNLTVVGATQGGHLTLWPADLETPFASNLNFGPGQTRANNAILRLSTDGLGDVAARAVVVGDGTVHLIVDVNGYFQ